MFIECLMYARPWMLDCGADGDKTDWPCLQENQGHQEKGETQRGSREAGTQSACGEVGRASGVRQIRTTARAGAA